MSSVGLVIISFNCHKDPCGKQSDSHLLDRYLFNKCLYILEMKKLRFRESK